MHNIREKIDGHYIESNYGINSDDIDMLENNPHEATYLNLDSQKARDKLDWDPQWDLSRTLDYTYDWYKKSLTTDNMQEFSFKQLNKYLEV